MYAALPPLAILDVGGPEILMILLVALLLFGSQRLPELARNLGKSIREFKKATSGLEEELKRAIEAPPPSPSPPPQRPANPAPLESPFKDAPHVPESVTPPASGKHPQA